MEDHVSPISSSNIYESRIDQHQHLFVSQGKTFSSANNILVVYILVLDYLTRYLVTRPWKRCTWWPSAAFRFSRAVSRKRTSVPEIIARESRHSRNVSSLIQKKSIFRTFLRSLSKASFRLNILRLSRIFAALLWETVATRRLGFFVVDDGRFGERPFDV